MIRFIGGEKLVVGIDLSDEFSQMSYCYADRNGEPETYSMTEGIEDYNIPTVLAKKKGSNQWLYGRQAVGRLKDDGYTVVKNLYTLAKIGEPVEMDDVEVDPVSMLTLYVKRLLSTLMQHTGMDKVHALTITVDRPDMRSSKVIKAVLNGLMLKSQKLFMSTHTESFYGYMKGQNEELMRGGVLLLEYMDGKIRSSILECNLRTTPKVVYMNAESHPFMRIDKNPAADDTLTASLRNADSEFARIAEAVLTEHTVSGVYLIGDEFSGEWMQESLKLLCRGRRVFQGNNLYSKGAAYNALEKIGDSRMRKGYVFLGADKLKSNIGMQLYSQGKEQYLAILDAGEDYFSVEKYFDFYIQDGNQVDLSVTSLTGNGKKTARIVMEGLDGGIHRINAAFTMEDEKTLIIDLEDMGMGVMSPASHKVWHEKLNVG
ncbi:MAG: hypothetical protein IJ608_07315 [Lachnospiraceae bacterium]|nr:hypothetical protein [Lachnospiraceae bacterium]